MNPAASVARSAVVLAGRPGGAPHLAVTRAISEVITLEDPAGS